MLNAVSKVFGTAFSIFLVLSIVGAPRPLIGTGNPINYGVDAANRLISDSYPTEPPDPLEWFLPKYPSVRSIPIVSSHSPLQTTVNNQVPTYTQPAPEPVPNVIQLTDPKEEFDRRIEEFRQEREVRLAKVREGTDRIRQGIRDMVERPNTLNNLP